MNALLRCLGAAAAGLSFGLAAVAQTAPAAPAFKSARDIPVSQFFALEAYRDVRMSPDGKKLLAVVPIKGRGNLAVIDLEARTSKAITTSDRWDVTRPRWIGNNRIYFQVVDGAEATGELRLKGAFSINPDGSGLREILGYNDAGSPVGLRIASILSVDADDDKGDRSASTAIVTMYERSREWPDVYRLDFRTLRRELLTFDTPGRTADWAIDNENRPRFAVRYEPRPARGQPFAITYWHRGPKGGAWEKLFEESSEDESTGTSFCGFAEDNRIAYVTARLDRDKAALRTFDTETRKFVDLVLEDPLVDISCGEEGGALIRDPLSKKIVGFSYDAGLPKRVYFDRTNEHFKLLEQLGAALPGHIRFALSPDRKRALVLASSDIDPGAYFLLDREKNQLEPIATRRPWFKPEHMAERRFITYKARDGLVIPAYLTLPRGANPKDLPLIINIHGGPYLRGFEWFDWGRWPEAQFFASRGYAVLEPEPRGSTGFGAKHFKSSIKQWGEAMQDDITDGALHLAREGIVDRNRICLHGGSYGGYATLQGLVREPDLFKCGHAFVAVTDLGLLQSVAWSDIAQNTRYDYLSNEFTFWVGDKDRDAALFERNSPARNADKIKAPVMLTMGSDDVRVPLIHGERMRDALRRAGKSVEWKVYASEGHGFNREENVTDFYTRSLRFYDEHIGPNRKPPP